MKKQSSYQKLKAENAKLRQQLRELATNPDSLEFISIRNKQQMLDEREKLLWSISGYAKNKGAYTCKGIIDFIHRHPGPKFKEADRDPEIDKILEHAFQEPPKGHLIPRPLTEEDFKEYANKIFGGMSDSVKPFEFKPKPIKPIS